MISNPCMVCGELTDNGPRCPDCERADDRLRIRHRPGKINHNQPAPEKRGYNKRWRRLSKLARRLQPFCSDCGATTDLQADHSPEAWLRHEKGLPVRLQDIDVVCGPCNRARGPARPRATTSRSKATNHHNQPRTHGDEERPPTTPHNPRGRAPHDPTGHSSPRPNSPYVLSTATIVVNELSGGRSTRDGRSK